MKLYKVTGAQPGQRWHGAKTGLKDFEEVELREVKGRAEMASFLNTNELEVYPKDNEKDQPDWPSEHEQAEAEDRDVLQEAEARAVAAASQRIEQVQRSWDATDIEDFILNRASVAQVANIFATLGTRYKELAGGTHASKTPG